jgi:hypothetical protein
MRRRIYILVSRHLDARVLPIVRGWSSALIGKIRLRIYVLVSISAIVRRWSGALIGKIGLRIYVLVSISAIVRRRSGALIGKIGLRIYIFISTSGIVRGRSEALIRKIRLRICTLISRLLLYVSRFFYVSISTIVSGRLGEALICAISAMASQDIDGY